MTQLARKPPWLRVRVPAGEQTARLRQTFDQLGIHTVCEHALCPNLGECWSRGTATIMLLGDTCTRACRFCAVASGNPRGKVDPEEPNRVAEAVARMELSYVVLTMVNRDDLADGGAGQVARAVRSIRQRIPRIRVETLVGDFGGSRRDTETVVQQGRPDVFAHNLEVVPRLQRAMRDARFSWEGSLRVLRWARQAGARVTKSSLMAGCGETDQEIIEALAALREAEVDIVTVGQYLRPSEKHAEVARYVEPRRFDEYREAGLGMGFKYVASAPLVRSSYRACEAFLDGLVGEDGIPGNRAGAKTTA